MNEKIVAAAIMLDTGLILHVPAPWGHGDIVSATAEYRNVKGERLFNKPLGGKERDVQGFITNTGRFVDRIEGLQIATREDQIVHKHPSYDILYSEDIWSNERGELYQKMLKLKEKLNITEQYSSYYQFWRQYVHYLNNGEQ